MCLVRGWVVDGRDWGGHLAPEPGTGCSVPVPAVPRGRGCPLPGSPGALLTRRVPGRLPALRQRHRQPQPPADPLPPDGQLVPEPALTLCHGAWVRVLAHPLPTHPEVMSPPWPASVCAVGVLGPCAARHRSCVCNVASWAVCHRASACVGAHGSSSRLPDHLWVPAALPSVSRLGSACQLANAVHLLVPAHLRGSAHLYPCLGRDWAVAARTGLGCVYEGAALVKLLCPCSAQHLQGPVL